MDLPPFRLKPSPFMMIPFIVVILAFMGIAAWHHAKPLQLAVLGISALSLAILAVALRRKA